MHMPEERHADTVNVKTMHKALPLQVHACILQDGITEGETQMPRGITSFCQTVCVRTRCKEEADSRDETNILFASCGRRDRPKDIYQGMVPKRGEQER